MRSAAKTCADDVSTIVLTADCADELAVALVGEPPKGLHGSSLSCRSKIR
jgi:hypothetical protein